MQTAAYNPGDRFQAIEDLILSGIDISTGDILEIKKGVYQNKGGTYLYNVLLNNIPYVVLEDILDLAVSDGELVLMPGKKVPSPIYSMGDTLIAEESFMVIAYLLDGTSSGIRIKKGDKINIISTDEFYTTNIEILRSDGTFDSNTYTAEISWNGLEERSVIKIIKDKNKSPLNNDGRAMCYWCNSPTKDIIWFFSPHKVCTRCGK